MKKTYIAIILCIIPATSLFAHPHVFIKNSSEFVFKENKLDGVWETWEFDRVFSADIISWLDVNQDGDFSADESIQVYNNAFINLQHYYYYTFIRQGNERTNPASVTKFRSHAKDGIMTYTFYIDLSSYTGNNIYFAVYDYTYFCDIEYKEPITLTYDETVVQPTYEIVENKNYPVYYNPVGAATDTTIYYKPGPGLYTYYPKEIHLTW
ncbi:MAG: hypothetical protein BKP49_06065 [Treponema sp. CETP13]|nr:MAG: hypothetical protein BKP49_06065 [Treponema sp. CETP13]